MVPEYRQHGGTGGWAGGGGMIMVYIEMNKMNTLGQITVPCIACITYIHIDI